MTTTSRDRLLTGIGLLAFVLYVLACRPAFSPDGTKILVPIHDPAHTNTAVWVYDCGQQTWTKVYESAGTYILPYVNWTGDGQQAVIVWGGESNILHVVAVPLAPGGASRHFALITQNDGIGALPFTSPPVQDRFFYHGNSNAVYRLDLRDGTITTGIVDGVKNILVMSDGRRLSSLVERANQMEFGLLDGDQFHFRVLQRLPHSVSGARGFFPFGERFVVVENQEVTVYRRGVSERHVVIGDNMELIDVIAGASDEVLYAAAWRENGGLYVGEIPLRNGSVRWTMLTTNAILKPSDSPCRVALSPDGRTLALSTGLDEIEPADRALFFVDLTTPTRKVAKVPLPVPPPAKQ